MLLAASVGITPMLAMLRHIVFEGLRKRRVRPTCLIVSSRTLANRAFSKEIDELVQRAGGAAQVIRVLNDTQGAEFKRDYEVWRIDMDLLTSFLPFNDYDFYLCGPGAFMQSIYDGLRVVNLVEEAIDVAVRIARLPDSSLQAIPVGRVGRVLCASPAYLAEHGVPKHPDDLHKGHTIIAATGSSSPAEWRLQDGERQILVRAAPRLTTTNDSAIAAARAGFGIARLLSQRTTAV